MNTNQNEESIGRVVNAPPATSEPAPRPVAEEKASKHEIEELVVEALRTCFDPEIPVNIYDLGLIYDVDVNEDQFVQLRMTLTSPACPVAGTLPPEVEHKVRALPVVAGASVEVVWDPPWNPDMMGEAAKLELGMF